MFPIASADFDYRYVVPAMPFACLAVGLALSAVRAGRRDAEEGDTEVEDADSRDPQLT